MGSSTAFALACLVVITAHELAHAVAGAALGGSPVVYGFSVDQGAGTAAETIWRAMAGPVFSLVSGVVLLLVPWRPASSAGALVWWWVGLLSVQEFAGYLITGPFVEVGDVGAALAAGQAPAWWGWVGFVVGWGLTALLGRTATRRLTRLTTSSGAPWPVQLRQLGLLSWLLGAAVAVVLSVGLLGAGSVPALVVVFECAGVLTSGLFLFFVRPFMGAAASQPRSTAPVQASLVVLVLLVLVAVARQLLLAGGLHL